MAGFYWIAMIKTQKKQYGKVAAIGCILCKHLGFEGTPCEIHHIRRTMPRKISPVIGLCPIHHRGNDGIHGLGRRAFEAKYRITEEELLVMTNKLINND